MRRGGGSRSSLLVVQPRSAQVQVGRGGTFYIKNKKHKEVGRREARHEHDEGFRRLLTRTPDAGGDVIAASTPTIEGRR